MSEIIKTMRLYWRQITVIVIPVLLSPLVFPYSQTSHESKCMFLVVLVAMFWILELLPIAITALVPIALRPLLGLSAAKDGIKVFFGDITMLLMGSVIVATALETTMLHKRVAYMVLYKIGLQPRRLLFGIILMSGLLSMWISNTAAAAMMLPITRALLQRLYAGETTNNGQIDRESKQTNGDQDEDENGRTNIIESADSEDLDNDYGNRNQNAHADVQLLSEDITIIASTSSECNSDRHRQTRQKLDEILSRRTKESTDNLALDSLEGNEDRVKIKGRANVRPRKLNYEVTWTAFSLSIAFATNIGGIGTLIGSPPNLLLNQALNTWNGQAELSFAQWSLFGLPCSLIILFLAYIWMSMLLFGIKSTVSCPEQRSKREIQLAANKVKEELDGMGPLKYNEKTALAHFIVLVTLWLTRRPGFVTGWSALFPEGSLTDSTVAIAVAISLFIFTNERPAVFCFRSKEDDAPPRSVPSLLSWQVVGKKFPWSVVFLIGGGSVLVDTIKISGLAESITSYMLVLKTWPNWQVCLSVIVAICFTTELCSNSVVAILTLPLLKNLTIIMNVHPLYLVFPACISASMAFMLPVATPPNSLVFSYGGVKLSEMAKAGFVMNIISICVIFLAVHTLGWYVFQMDIVPDWVKLPLNETAGNNSSALNFTL